MRSSTVSRCCAVNDLAGRLKTTGTYGTWGRETLNQGMALLRQTSEPATFTPADRQQ